jgi:hypothetical protein
MRERLRRGAIHVERTIEGRPILWTDRSGLTHRCERTELIPAWRVARARSAASICPRMTPLISPAMVIS